MKKKAGNGILFGLIAGMLWGLDGTLLGRAGSSQSFLCIVLFIACIHDGLAALWIFTVNLCHGTVRQYWDCLHSKQCINVFFCALLGGAAGMALNVIAINLAGASYACAVTSAYPAAGAVLGMIFLKEKCSTFSLLGIVFIVFGAVMAGISPAAEVQTPHFLLGIAAAVAAMLCWAAEGILSKSAMDDISSDVLIGIRELISCAVYIPILFFIVNTEGFSVQNLISSGNFILAALASAAGAFSYLCWYRSMDISGITTGMSLNATYAFWALIFDILMNGKKPSLLIFIGVAVILLGTVLTIYSDGNKENLSMAVLAKKV